MKFGLSEETIEKLCEVFEANPKVDKAFIFGSRAKDSYRDDSDIDIAIKGYDLGMDDILELSVAFEDKGITNKIDLLDYNIIQEPALVEHIDRVGVEFYSRWREYVLADILNLIGGGTPKTTIPEYWGGQIPWLSVTDFNTGKKYCFDAEKKITERGLAESSTKILKKGQIIISARGTVGVISMLGSDMAFNQSNYGIDAKKEITSNEFLYYLLKTNLHNFISSSHGAVFDTITTDTFKQINVSIPPKPEQFLISGHLSSLDNKIDLLHRQNKTLEELAETLFRQWFVEEAEENWEETNLADHTEVFRGLSYKGSGLTNTDNGIPMHNLNSVKEGGGYKYNGIKFYNGEFKDRHTVSIGDIIVTNTEQGHNLQLIGYPAIIPDYYGSNGIFSQHIYKIVPLRTTYLTREFIYYLLMIPIVREQITAATNGSTVNMLAINGLQRPTFKLPPKDKVNLFTMISGNYWTKKNINQKQIQSLTKLRDTLLPKLMSGEVRIKM